MEGRRTQPVDFGHLRTGDAFRLTENTVNSMIDAAKAFRKGQLGEVASGSPAIRFDGIAVDLCNTTGGDIEAFCPVGLDGVPIRPGDNEWEFRSLARLKAAAPVWPKHVGRWGITLEPVANKSVGKVVMAGVYICRVDASEFPTGRYADISQKSTDESPIADRLKVAPYGAARIVWREDDDGDGDGLDKSLLWAVVLLGPTQSPEFAVEVGDEWSEDDDASESNAVPSYECKIYRQDRYRDAEYDPSSTVGLDDDAEPIRVFDPLGVTSGGGGTAKAAYSVANGRYEFVGGGVSGFQIRNDTGEDLEAGQIVGLDEPVSSPDDERPGYFDDPDEDSPAQGLSTITMSGVPPEFPKHAGRFAVAKGRIPSGKTGPAVATGEVWCKVDFTKFPNGKYAEIDWESPTTETLTAYPVGSARILGTVGEWSVVRLGDSADGTVFRGRLTDRLVAGGSAKCMLSIDDSEVEVTVCDDLLEGNGGATSVPAETRVRVSFHAGKFWLDEAQCKSDDEEEEEQDDE